MNTHQINDQNSNCCEQAKVEHSPSMTLTRPNVDLYESENMYTLLVEMPGVDETSVEVQLEKEVLTIEGESRMGKLEGYHLIAGDLGHRKYQRSFRISDDINRQGIDAVITNGVLRLTMPKSAESKSQKLEVRQG